MTAKPLEDLIKKLAKIPGLGTRSARRATLHLINNPENIFEPLISEMKNVLNNVKSCNVCGNLDLSDTCSICSDHKREDNRICVVEAVSDLWALERAGTFYGRYHIIGGTLSAIDGIGPEELNLNRLFIRAKKLVNGEIILATSATLDGQTTAHYISSVLSKFNLTITKLAYGVPVGGELNYLDDGTLIQAMKARRPI